MFPTRLDDTLQHLSLLEKHPIVSLNRPMYRIMSHFQSELRFFRMVLWCNIPDSDAYILIADLNFIASCIDILYKLDPATDSLALPSTDFNPIISIIENELTKCYVHLHNGHYRRHVGSLCWWSGSFVAERFTSSNEPVEFFDSVLEIINDILKVMGKKTPALRRQIESLEGTVFLLRNLVYYTSPMGDSESVLILQHYVHHWATKVACFSLLYRLTIIEDEDEDSGVRIRNLCIYLQQIVDPCEPEFINTCFEGIKAAKTKPEDRLLFGEFVSRFVDFFLENLMLVLNDNDVQMVREGLIFVISFLADPPSNAANHSELTPLVREQIYAVLDRASDIMCFFHEANIDLSRGKTILDRFKKSLDEVRGDIVNLYVHIPHSSWSSFPRINGLGYFENMVAYLENLKETMNQDKKLVPFLKHRFFAIREELLPLRFLLQDTTTMQNKHEELKDTWEQIMCLLYQVDFAIKSSFFIDNTIWYNMTCLSFVGIKIKDIRYKFETRTEGSHVSRTESILPLMSFTDVPRPTTSTSNVEVVVGFEKEIELLIDRLECGSDQLDIVSIVGMGGIGKTALARKLYNESSIIHHFHKRAFCSVSQVYRKKNVLLDIYSDISLVDDEIRQMNDEDLAHRLYQRLKGFRYLIVVDDIWDINVWEDLKRSFPDDRIGSRIIFTSRINTISLIAKPDSTPCPLPFLSNDESWELLQQKIFHKDLCPEHLLNAGKLIANNCRGLPLAIVVIAGLLARTERSLLQWNEVADTLSSSASSQGCHDIIKLSYKQLPEALKFCFLYLGAFREDKNLEAKKLALLCVAEGFVLRSGSSCLYKTAKKYLNDLGDTNLITVTKRSCNGGIKCFRVHDLIRDFCRTEAQEELYMCYINACNKNFQMSGVLYRYRISIEAEWRSFVDAKLSGPTVHSLVYFSDYASTFFNAAVEVDSIQSLLCNFKHVEVLDLLGVIFDAEFPIAVTTLVHLRYLALWFSSTVDIPPDISNLWNLETLVLWGLQFLATDEGVFLCRVMFPNDIWKMKRLRHVDVFHMAYVAFDDVTGDFSPLPDLETFTALNIPPEEEGAEELLRRLSNVRKFSCICSGWWDEDRECYQLPKLEILTKLESLTMVLTGDARPPFLFSIPTTIRKLTLEMFSLSWNEFSAIIGKLSCLEVVVLGRDSFKGRRWDVEDDEFSNIKSLTLKDLDVEEWNASTDSFPSLEKLVVSSCLSLVEIPPCFSDVVTLNCIKVDYCGRSVADSAIQIQKDQIDSGNEKFEVNLVGIET